MGKEPLITVFTQVYNTKESYLKKCIDSVLNQTYTNFEYFIFDNGSNNNQFVLNEYVNKDNRIRLTRININIPGFRYWDISEQTNGIYLTTIDSDDWWDAEYLSSLVKFTLENDLDIAYTGSYFHNNVSNNISKRSIESPMIIHKRDFNKYFSIYHQFFRVLWGNLVKTTYAKQYNPKLKNVIYGGDTVSMLYWLSLTNKIGIDSSVLHHYRMHQSSMSYKYDSRRFDSDIFLYNDAIDFLESYGPISSNNKSFLHIVYANALIDTLNVIRNSKLSDLDKLNEYKRIATHTVTETTYKLKKYNEYEPVINSKKLLLRCTFESLININDDIDNYSIILKTICPLCGDFLSKKYIPLFMKDESLFEYLIKDDVDELLKLLLSFVEKRKYINFNIGDIICSLAKHKLPLCSVNDIIFLQQYKNLYIDIWNEKYIDSLDEMTGLLLEDRVNKAKETFLNIYISLSSILNQETPFIFGKIQLAYFYLDKKMYNNCNEIISELKDIGLSDNEDVLYINEFLNKISKNKK